MVVIRAPEEMPVTNHSFCDETELPQHSIRAGVLQVNKGLYTVDLHLGEAEMQHSLQHFAHDASTPVVRSQVIADFRGVIRSIQIVKPNCSYGLSGFFKHDQPTVLSQIGVTVAVAPVDNLLSCLRTVGRLSVH